MLFRALAPLVLFSPLTLLIGAAGVPSKSNSTSSAIASASASASPGCINCASCNSTNTNSTPGSLPSNGTTGGNRTSSGPQFVIYSDMYVDGVVPDPIKVEGYTVFALSFLAATKPTDQAAEWAKLDSSKRKDLKSKYNAAGIKLIVSAFGSEEKPTTSGSDPTKTAQFMAGWVKQYDLDGIDVDYEDFDAMDKGDGKAEEWITTFTKTLRSELPQGQYILTHAPVAPWFSPGITKGGAYLTVHKNVGDLIDWYNVQFYNQQDYSDCTTLLTKSKTATKASVFEIAASDVDLNKIVIGKSAQAGDASDGYMEPKMIATCLSQAKQKGWNAGAMVWEYPHADSSWIKAARGDAFPIGQ